MGEGGNELGNALQNIFYMIVDAQCDVVRKGRYSMSVIILTKRFTSLRENN